LMSGDILHVLAEDKHSLDTIKSSLE